MNKWNIPEWLEKEVRERDKVCVYCGVQMTDKMPSSGSRRNVATWEHIINNASIITRENIARCCFACNSSKGTKSLAEWLQSYYCMKKGITIESVADVIKKAINVE
jgi:5-methylcytosine-specific restriction endonuclease McrA